MNSTQAEMKGTEQDIPGEYAQRERQHEYQGNIYNSRLHRFLYVNLRVPYLPLTPSPLPHAMLDHGFRENGAFFILFTADFEGLKHFLDHSTYSVTICGMK